jgi:hypothetical protein
MKATCRQYPSPLDHNRAATFTIWYFQNYTRAKTNRSSIRKNVLPGKWVTGETGDLEVNQFPILWRIQDVSEVIHFTEEFVR